MRWSIAVNDNTVCCPIRRKLRSGLVMLVLVARESLSSLTVISARILTVLWRHARDKRSTATAIIAVIGTAPRGDVRCLERIHAQYSRARQRACVTFSAIYDRIACLINSGRTAN